MEEKGVRANDRRSHRRKYIMQNHQKTAVLLIAPETGQLPDEMGPLAHFISGKSGGLGEVIAALCEGLTQRGVDCHIATPNLKKRFKQENCLDEDQWHNILDTINPDRIHLVKSSIYDDLASPYEGDPLLNAAEFQKALVNHVITDIRARHGGNLIIHSHDWMAGGVITAYARSRGCPVLHTLHNVHTGNIPVNLFFGVDTDSLSNYLYLSGNNGGAVVDSQATAIKNASMVSIVGQRFLGEIVDDHFADQAFIPPNVSREVRIKCSHDAVFAIINAPARCMYPEHCRGLFRRYSANDDVIAAKRENLVAFQKRTGLNVNPEAILLYWPSRLDPSQKGIELFEAIAHRFVVAHDDVQIAIVGNGVGNDRTHEEICGRIACSSGGRITYQRFSDPLCMLGFAAASDVFGASLYEPCGQIDQVGNLFGATATNRDTGGYHDKIHEMTLTEDGAPKDSGNGFLFRDYDTGGLWYGMEKSVRFHRFSPEIRERNLKRIMRETRKIHNVELMIEKYLAAYEQLNGGIPLA